MPGGKPTCRPVCLRGHDVLEVDMGALELAGARGGQDRARDRHQWSGCWAESGERAVAEDAEVPGSPTALTSPYDRE